MAGWRLPALRPASRQAPPELVERRALGAGSPPWEPDPTVSVTEAVIANVPCVICEPRQASSVSLYFHGGGYRLGSAHWSTPFATRLARAASTKVVVVDYRLAPEHPFPACVHDAAAVYDWLLGQREERIVAVGDSAGGGLAAALTVAAARSEAPAPAGLVLFSAWLDLTCTAPTFGSRAGSDQLFSLESARQAADLYLQGHDALDPLASPGLSALGTWPPALVLASTAEVLLHDSVAFASAAALGGGPVTAIFEPEMPHAWPAVFPGTPESAAALEAVAGFYRQLC